jgi:glycosyltransferase involved in cell wall biosynthesis
MAEPTISVALCTRNGERFISDQIASILGQTVVPDELVVSDDGSTDATLELVEGAIGNFRAANPERDVRLRVLRNETALGVVRNFEQAIVATTGDLIALCDQDDRWHPRRIELAVAEFETRPDLLLLYGDARLVDERGAPLRHSLFEALEISATERDRVRAGDALGALMARNLVTGATTMIRRTLLGAALPFPTSWLHDEWLAAIAAATGSIDYLDSELIDYRQHGANVIGAERLGMGAKLGKLREPRESRNQLLRARASDLVDRLTALGAAARPNDLELARGKLAHEDARLALPPGHFARVPPVIRELRSNGYRRFGRGLQDVLRDLVQPSA